jgi:beta-galactosidase/beta-glucuronidase
MDDSNNPLNRRRFLTQAAQVGMGLGLGGPLVANESLSVGDQGAHSKQPSGAHSRGQCTSGEKKPSTSMGTPNTVVPLEGEWLLATDPQNVGRAQKWFTSDLRGATPTRVPGIIQEDFPAYHGVAWYCREFVAPIHPYTLGRYLLHFEAVDYLAEVWVNGIPVGLHEGGETPFVLDATEAIKPDVANRLTVRVLNPTNQPIDGIALKQTPHRNKFVPYFSGATYDSGGIIGPVQLLMVPAARIENLFVRPDWKTGKIKLQTTLYNASGKQSRCHLRVAVAPATPGEALA